MPGAKYRWIIPDCKCYFTDNIYIKESMGLPVDRYFKLKNPTMSESDFWTHNDDARDIAQQQRSDIFDKAVKEGLRRRRVPAAFAENAATCAAKYVPRHPELFAARETLPDAATLGQDSFVAELRYPDLARGLPAEDVFLPHFLEAWQAVQRGEDKVAGFEAVHAECFQFPLFQKSFCKKIVEEVEHFKAAGLPHQYPNAMNRNGCILNEIGLGPLMDQLISVYLGPVAMKFYGRFLSEGFEAHHSFIVAYSEGTDTSLGVHDDNSEVTINIALRDDYGGASLALYQHARTPQPTEVAEGGFEWRVGAGTALMHPGEMLHEVLPLESGNRMGLIIWLRSTRWRSKNGCPLCLNHDGLLYAPGPEGGPPEVLREEN